MEPNVEIAMLKIQLANAEDRAAMWEKRATSYGCRIEQLEGIINELLTEVKQLEELDGT
jgi:hypothetical protein